MPQKKFIGVLMLLCCLSLFSVFGVSHYLFTKNLQNDFHKISAADMELFRLETKTHLSSHLNMIKALSRTPAIRNFDYTSTQTLLAEFKKTYPDIDVVLSDNKGQQIIRGDNAFLTQIPNFYFYKEAMKGTEEVFSEYLVSQRNGQALVVMAVPVRAEDGTVIGVLQGNLYLDILRTFVANHSANGMTAYIVDSEGKMIAHPTEPVVPTRRQDLSNEPFIQKALKGESGITEITASGVRKMVNYSYDPSTGWILCIEKSYDEYDSKVTELFIFQGIIFAVTILANTIVSILSLKDASQA